jgi:hypothetical protein
VRDVLRLIDNSEYKRRQAAPGIKISSMAFGVGRRFPIAADYPPCRPPCRTYRASPTAPAEPT